MLLHSAKVLCLDHPGRDILKLLRKCAAGFSEPEEQISKSHKIKTTFWVAFYFGRRDWIRTSDPQLPKLMRYQTALHAESVFDVVSNLWGFLLPVKKFYAHHKPSKFSTASGNSTNSPT